MNTEGPTSPPLRTETGVDYGAGQHPAPANRKPAPAASPLRISAGVVALVLSVVGIIFAGAFLFSKHGGASTPFNGWMNFFLIVGSIGCLVTGIVIIAKQRKRGGATPWLVASFAALVVIACLGFMSSGNSGLPGAPVITLPAALATAILAVLVVVKDKTPR
ncbi:hypothetical protein [Pseudarthrobacter sp. S9]|uniref:hypothetical protein n=1 Tax=Pseudarthrobacter sp. S9 TaxID=3418421 RepID=UPI003D02CFE4